MQSRCFGTDVSGSTGSFDYFRVRPTDNVPLLDATIAHIIPPVQCRWQTGARVYNISSGRSISLSFVLAHQASRRSLSLIDATSSPLAYLPIHHQRRSLSYTQTFRHTECPAPLTSRSWLLDSLNPLVGSDSQTSPPYTDLARLPLLLLWWCMRMTLNSEAGRFRPKSRERWMKGLDARSSRRKNAGHLTHQVFTKLSVSSSVGGVCVVVLMRIGTQVPTSRPRGCTRFSASRQTYSRTCANFRPGPTSRPIFTHRQIISMVG